MAGLSAGHLFTDLNQGAVAALLPFLIAERGISLAAAGADEEIPMFEQRVRCLREAGQILEEVRLL